AVDARAAHGLARAREAAGGRLQAMTLQAYGLTDVGPVRGTNEDCFVSVDDLRLFVVADGMGGHAAGEVASQVAVESIEQFIRRSRDTSDGLWPFGIDTAL